MYEASGEKIIINEYFTEYTEYMARSREAQDKRVEQFNEDLIGLYNQYTTHALQNPEKRKLLQEKVTQMDNELENLYISDKKIWTQGRVKKLKILPLEWKEAQNAMEEFDLEMDAYLSSSEAGYKQYKEILSTYNSLIEFLNVRQDDYFVEDDTLFFTNDFDIELYNYMYEKLYRMLEGE